MSELVCRSCAFGGCKKHPGDTHGYRGASGPSPTEEDETPASEPTRYAAYPDHPLHRVPQAVLDAARSVTDAAVKLNDLARVHSHPLADAVVQTALPELRRWLLSPRTGPAPVSETYVEDRWVLVVELRTREEQVESDPELTFPNDEASRIVRRVTDLWHLLPEQVEECVRWTDTRLEVTGEILDYFLDLLPWVMMETIPLRLELSRVGVKRIE